MPMAIARGKSESLPLITRYHMHMPSWMCVSNDQPRSLSLPTASMGNCETIGIAIEIAKIDKITW